jgi:hypothetical protein
MSSPGRCSTPICSVAHLLAYLPTYLPAYLPAYLLAYLRIQGRR